MPQEKKALNVQIGSRIKAAREHAHLTQEKLAEEIGVSVQYTSDLERGKVGASVKTIIKLCQALHTSADYLLLDRQKPHDAASILESLAGLSEGQLLIVEESLQATLRALEYHDPPG